MEDVLYTKICICKSFSSYLPLGYLKLMLPNAPSVNMICLRKLISVGTCALHTVMGVLLFSVVF